MDTNQTNGNIIEESVLGKIGQKVRIVKNEVDMSAIWNNRTGKMKHGTFHSKNINDKDFNEISTYFDKMKKSDKYNEYKKYFDAMCKKCNIPIDGCIIQRYYLKRGKNNKNEICITYTNTKQKITIPQDCELYHITQYEGTIKELKPTFKGKSARGYLYSDPRVYLTIRKKMPKLCADIKPNSKTTTYRVKENIRTAYVDPLIPGYKFGAVYVATKFPIPVEKVEYQKKIEIKPMKESENLINDYNDEIPNFVSLEEFVEYYGLTIIDDNDDIIQESFASKIGAIERKIHDDNFIKRTWENLSSKISHKKITKKVSESDYRDLQKNYDILKSSKIYETYKKAYEKICKFFNLPPQETTIKSITLEDDKKNNTFLVTINFHVGKKKIVIPNGVQLIHTSPSSNIKEIVPKFYSKKQGMYMWPTKRVYFTLDKAIDQKKVGIDKENKSFMYTPKETIKTAYIDSELPKFSMSCIYVDTAFPIPVKNLNKDDKKEQKVL